MSNTDGVVISIHQVLIKFSNKMHDFIWIEYSVVSTVILHLSF